MHFAHPSSPLLPSPTPFCQSQMSINAKSTKSQTVITPLGAYLALGAEQIKGVMYIHNPLKDLGVIYTKGLEHSVKGLGCPYYNQPHHFLYCVLMRCHGREPVPCDTAECMAIGDNKQRNQVLSQDWCNTFETLLNSFCSDRGIAVPTGHHVVVRVPYDLGKLRGFEELSKAVNPRKRALVPDEEEYLQQRTATHLSEQVGAQDEVMLSK